MQVQSNHRVVQALSRIAQAVIPQWYALHTRSNFESRVTSDLGNLRFETYLPAFEELHRWKDRKKIVSVPIFPGYVFARFSDLPVERAMVVKTRGLVRILGTGSEIEPVPDAEIERLRQILNAKQPCFVHPFIREGDRVRVERGVLRGLEGFLIRVRNQHRLVISISLLSQAVATEIDACDVKSVGGRGATCV
jgi:transcription antitermination factor NusG